MDDKRVCFWKDGACVMTDDLESELRETKTEIHTEPYLVAYLDMLGSKERIQNDDEEEESLNTIKEIYEYALQIPDEINPSLSHYHMEMRIFSDNILIVNKLVDENGAKRDLIVELENMCTVVTRFQEHALENGWLLRGAMTKGQLYFGDRLVWGKALVKAYRMEEKTAIYPRVIIDDELVDSINSISPSQKGVKVMALRQDADGCYFLDYLDSMICFKFQCDDEKYAERFRKMFSEPVKDESVRQKRLWHVRYHNSVCIEQSKQEYCIDETIVPRVVSE